MQSYKKYKLERGDDGFKYWKSYPADIKDDGTFYANDGVLCIVDEARFGTNFIVNNRVIVVNRASS